MAVTKIGDWHGAGFDIELWEADVNFASIAAGAIGSIALTVAGAKTTDKVVGVVHDTPTKGLAECGAKVTAANTVTVYATNPSAGALDEASLKWLILLFKL